MFILNLFSFCFILGGCWGLEELIRFGFNKSNPCLCNKQVDKFIPSFHPVFIINSVIWMS